MDREGSAQGLPVPSTTATCSPVQHPPAPLVQHPRQNPVTFSLMKAQMIRVISSPSISTTGLATLIRLSASRERWQGVRGACLAPPAPAPQLCTVAWGQESSRIQQGSSATPALGRVQVRVQTPLGCRSRHKPYWGLGQFMVPTLPGAKLGCRSGYKTPHGSRTGTRCTASQGRTWVQAGVQIPVWDLDWE